ncbi:MAG: ABC transporter permease subunit, partial [Phycisphaerales bacterium JB039]
PEESWAVARHFATPEGQRINSALGLALPTLWSVARSEAFVNPEVPPADDEVFLEAVGGSKPMTWPQRTKITRRMTNIVDSVVRLGTIEPEAALAQLQQDIDREMSSELARGEFPRVRWPVVIGAAGAGAGVLIIGFAAWWLRGQRGRLQGKRERAGLVMASPWMIGLCLFIAAPMLLSLLLAFMRWSGLSTIDQAEWVGLANFREMLGRDERFQRAAWITFVYALISVPAGQIVALGAAMLLTNPVRLVNAFRAMWYLPTVLAGVAMAILWWSVFDADGLMNGALGPLLGLVKLSPPAWFGADARWAGVIAYAIASLWTFGGAMLIYLAGLHAIPKHLYEAAEIDGAGPLRRLKTVTLPMLSPVILFNMVIAIITSFQVFTQAYIMTKGGPADATLFFVLYLYEEAFEHHEMGYASALAWALFVVVFVLTLVVLRMSRKRVHYEGIAL